MAGSTAERLVVEWLNRRGFFTIRQVSSGPGDMDILAMKLNKDGSCCCQHYEVQGADDPMGYIVPYKSKIAKERNEEEMKEAIRIWLKKRYYGKIKKSSENQNGLPDKANIRKRIADCPWTFHFVVHNVKYQEELKILYSICENEKIKVKITRLLEIRDRLQFQKFLGYQSSEKNLVNLATMDNEADQKRRFENFLKKYVIEPMDNGCIKVKDLKMHLRDIKLIPKWLSEIEEFDLVNHGSKGNYLMGWKFRQDFIDDC